MAKKQWLTTKELAKIKNISERAVRKAVSQNKYISRKIGKSYEILVTSLEENVREKLTEKAEILHPLTEKMCKQCVKALKSCDEQVASAKTVLCRRCKSIDLTGGNKEAPESAKKLALAKYDLVKKWDEYRNKQKNSKTKAGKEFLEIYNRGLLNEELFKITGKVAIGTIYEWHKKLNDYNDNYQILIRDFDYNKPSKTSLKAQEESILLQLLLHPSQINVGKAIKLTKHTLKERGITDLHCDMTYRRFVENYKKQHYDTWVFTRKGMKALKDEVVPYIPRDASVLDVGEVLIADGHRLAFQVVNPFTGKPCRPMLVGYQDWKSGALIGFEIMLEENTQCLASALRNSIINLGKIPSYCYYDNGKANKSNYFNGVSGLFANLGIQPIFAKPYNAKAKVIERFFRELQDSFEVFMPSYVGSSIAKRPAHLKRNEKIHKQNHNEYIPTIEEILKYLNKWLSFHYAQPCPNVKGKSIGEVLTSGKGSGVDIARLDDLMMAQEIKTIRRNGIRFLKADYYDESLYGLRNEVVIKYSLFDLSSIKVYTTKGKFICSAKRIEAINPLANYIGTPKDMEELKQQTKLQKQLENKTAKKYLKELKQEKAYIPLLEEENLEIAAVEIDKSEVIEIIKEEKTSEPTIFNSKFERFEHLSTKENLSETDTKWIDKYKQSDEYRQIYESEEKCIKNL